MSDRELLAALRDRLPGAVVEPLRGGRVRLSYDGIIAEGNAEDIWRTLPAMGTTAQIMVQLATTNRPTTRLKAGLKKLRTS